MEIGKISISNSAMARLCIHFGDMLAAKWEQLSFEEGNRAHTPLLIRPYSFSQHCNVFYTWKKQCSITIKNDSHPGKLENRESPLHVAASESFYALSSRPVSFRAAATIHSPNTGRKEEQAADSMTQEGLMNDIDDILTFILLMVTSPGIICIIILVLYCK